jgi:hypothetical protein
MAKLENLPNTIPKDKADALAEAKRAEDAARGVLKDARTLVRGLHEAGDQMWMAVKAAETEVDYAIARTTDPRDIMAHFQQNVVGSYHDLIGLGGGAANTAASAATKLQSASLNQKNPALQEAIGDLHLAVAKVVQETKSLSALMDSSSIPGVADGITQCLTAAQGLSGVVAVRVIPNSITLTPGSSQTVRVIGTTKPELDKVPSSAPITWKATPSGGNTSVEVTADAAAQAGEYMLHITVPISNNDTLERTVKVVVTSGAPPAPSAPPGAADSEAINNFLTDKGWTCGAAKKWVLDPAPGGGTRATLVCDTLAAAQKVLSDHQTQVDALRDPKKNNTVTAEADGKLRIVIPGAADARQFLAALQAALQ